MANFYCAPAGSGGSNGNAGSIGSPKLTIRDSGGAGGASLLNAGDTLFIRAGDWGDQIIESSFAHTGTAWTAGNFITIKAYPGETVRLRPVSDAVVRFSGSSIHHVLVKDIILDGSGDNGHVNGADIGNGAHDIHLENVEIDAFTWNGIIGDGDLCEFRDCNVHGNGREGLVDGIYNHANGLYWGGTNTNVIGGRYWDNETYGIRWGTSDAGHNYGGNVADGATCYQNGYHIGLGGASPSSGAGGGFVIGDDGNCARNCLAFGNFYGVVVYGHSGKTSTGVRVFNNTIYGNVSTGVYVFHESGPLVGTLIKNNIIYGNGATIVDEGSGTVTTTNLTTDPAFVNAGADDFHLQYPSDALDVGTDLTASGVTIDFDLNPRAVGHFDIGAYQRTELVVGGGGRRNVFESSVFASRVLVAA